MKTFTITILFAIIILGVFSWVMPAVAGEDDSGNFVFDPNTDLTPNSNDFRPTTGGLSGIASDTVSLGFIIAGGLAICTIIASGIYVLFAGPDPEKRKNGYKALIYSIIGLIVVIMAYVVVNIVGNVLEQVDQ